MEDIRKQKGENPFAEPVEMLSEADPHEVADRAGAEWEDGGAGSGRIRLPVLHGEVRVLFPGIDVEATPGLSTFTIKLLSLLYLANGDGTRPAGEWVAYRDLAGGRFYEPVLKRSVEDPLAGRFGGDVEGFLNACGRAGGERLDLADAACSFPLFPLVPVALLLWRGDDEFPARVQALFDRNSTHHLNAFDLRMGAQEIASMLIKGPGEA
jgi:hypothetical protein